MEKVVLKATRRTIIGKQVGALRREGKLPAVMYGHNFEATPVTLDLRSTTRLLSNLTASSLIIIDLDGKEHAALIQEKQRDYIRGTILHIDFRVVSLTEKIRTYVPVELVGLSPAIKDYNGVVITGVSEVEVECLPQDLPERFTVDLSKLARIGDSVYISNLQKSDKVDILTDNEEMVVTVVGAEGSVEIEAPTIEIETSSEPEVIEKGKKEEEVEE